jgi:FlaA1/EpsC-like NDP-sugar epimerase
MLPKIKTPRWVILVSDAIISSIALLISFFIRFDLNFGLLKQEFWDNSLNAYFAYILIKISVLFAFKIHKGLIRYTSYLDVVRLFYASVTCTFVFFIASAIRYNRIDQQYLLPLSILIIEFFISFSMLIIFRFGVKLIFIETQPKNGEKINVLIYGAGVSGLITKRTIEKNQKSNLEVKGYIDDNEKIINTRIQGIKIYSSKNLKNLIIKYDIKKVIIAIQTPDYENKNKILETCIEYSVEVLQVPSSKKWINGDFSTSQIKTIKIDDLLGRNPIYLEKEIVRQDVKNKTILVTGAAGSIGSGIVKQLANFEPKKVILLDQAESNLYELEQELKYNQNDFNFSIVVGDICNIQRMNRLFEYFKPDYVFHAAAYKHVPLMEDNPSEAIYTNVYGTKNIVELSVKYNVKKFVFVSTDKAVNPTNVMGASKRIAEILIQSQTNSSTRFITTRFGNVLGSNGSVIPLFKKQIEQGGPITITDDRITRYFMTIPEACQLVLEACSMGNGSEIYVFDMGESVKIIDLAKKMIKLSGLELNKDIQINITGLRPGEKLYEELLASEENTKPTHHPKILIAEVRKNDIGVLDKINHLIQLYYDQNNIEIVKLMKEIVPEYISNNSEYSKLD